MLSPSPSAMEYPTPAGLSIYTIVALLFHEYGLGLISVSPSVITQGPCS
jgi:hypothetical protein